MANSFAGGIQLVDVTTDIFSNGVAKKQLWAAAISRELAVGLVLGAVPEGWSAILATTRLTPDEMAKLKMSPGDVREMRGRSETARGTRFARRMV
jgi:glycosyltransferase A (GT-A) superfamily protein (DUF2064 family)